MSIDKEKIQNIEADLLLEGADDHVLPLLPLKNMVLLPKSILPIIVGRTSSIKAVEHALKLSKTIFVTAQKDPDTENPTLDDIFEYGTRSTILQVMRMQNGSLKILVEGLQRAKITGVHDIGEFTTIFYEDIEQTKKTKTAEFEASWRLFQDLYTTYAKLNDKAPQDLIGIGPDRTLDDIDYVVDTAAVHLNLAFDERQKLLEIPDLKKRIVKICEILKKEVEILEVENRIRGRIQTQV